MAYITKAAVGSCNNNNNLSFQLIIPNVIMKSNVHCQAICLPFQLFLFLEELSNITYPSLLTLTVVQNLVRSNQLIVSHFVIQRQLLPLRPPETPCRPSKGVPFERLWLVKWFISHRLHTGGACVNLVLLTYVLEIYKVFNHAPRGATHHEFLWSGIQQSVIRQSGNRQIGNRQSEIRQIGNRRSGIRRSGRTPPEPPPFSVFESIRPDCF